MCHAATRHILIMIEMVWNLIPGVRLAHEGVWSVWEVSRRGGLITLFQQINSEIKRPSLLLSSLASGGFQQIRYHTHECGPTESNFSQLLMCLNAFWSFIGQSRANVTYVHSCFPYVHANP